MLCYTILRCTCLMHTCKGKDKPVLLRHIPCVVYVLEWHRAPSSVFNKTSW